MRDDNGSMPGTKIFVKNNDIGRAMRKLKKVMQNEKVFQTIREKEFFEKPSIKRKRARANAVKRWQKYLASKDK
jgi:small subunit ribosomal protein S21